jgi:hypothetical protein
MENEPVSRAEHLKDRVNRNGPINEPRVPRPLLTLEEFFEGNDYYGSIGCNLPAAVYPHEFFEVFQKLRDRPDVADVLVEVKSWDDPEDWPFSDTVWVITSLSRQDIQQRLGKRLRGDVLRVGWPEHPIECVEVPPGTRPIAVWWD